MKSSDTGFTQPVPPSRRLIKRAELWGSAFHILLQHLICPLEDEDVDNDPTTECDETGWDDDEMVSDSLLQKRDRKTPKRQSFCSGGGVITYHAPAYHALSTLQTDCPACEKYGWRTLGDCLDFTFSTINTVISDTQKYQTEHGLEMQLLVSVDGSLRDDPIELVAQVWLGTDDRWKDEFRLLDTGVNNCKGAMWGTGAIRRDSAMRAFQSLKDCIMALDYLRDPIVNNTLVLEKNRVKSRLAAFDNTVVPTIMRAGASQGRRGRLPWPKSHADKRFIEKINKLEEVWDAFNVWNPPF
ncbi:hypothetical protein F5Y14DRAFT_458446 [Nemania sp. NC0429]|nr:hypothetical protein F5Y14DRAFT_458446 [Nemania sp. NC0429]